MGIVSPRDGEPSMICLSSAPSPHASTIDTYLKPHQRLTLIILIRRHTRRLPPNYTQFHMLNFQSHKQKVYPPHNHILQMVFRFRILKLNMQTILNTHIHLYTRIRLGGYSIAIDPNVFFSNHIGHAARDGDTNEVAELDVYAGVGFVLFFDVFEVEVERLGVLKVARSGQLLAQGEEFVVVAAVEEHLF